MSEGRSGIETVCGGIAQVEPHRQETDLLRLMGTETEYGLSVEGKGPEHLAEETARLIRAVPFVHSERWDYSAESPLQDVRGFRAASMAINPRDAEYDGRGGAPSYSAAVKVERILGNGGRLYNDHGHPEYSTPECSSVRELVAQELAGERILAACAKALERKRERRVRLYKNNTDFHGFSYGAHENYLVIRPEKNPEEMLNALVPFFVTRQIYAGAGKVGVEAANGGEAKGAEEFCYQLSQRADFFSSLMGTDTLHERPLINTRDEPHAKRRFMRLHVILGDANRSQYALALKLGSTALALRLAKGGWRPRAVLADPLGALREISRDQERRWIVELENGKRVSAVEVQGEYLEAAEKEFAGEDEEIDWILRNWREILGVLAKTPLEAADRLDWAAKLMLLESYRTETGAEEPRLLQSLDLEYHNLDPEESLFAPLEESGEIRRVVTEAEIAEAMEYAPRATRAGVRGEAIRRFRGELKKVSWGRMEFDSTLIDMGAMVDEPLEDLNQQLEGAANMRAYAEIIRRWQDEHYG